MCNLDIFTIADLAVWPWVYALHQNYDDAITVRAILILAARQLYVNLLLILRPPDFVSARFR